MVKFSVTLIKAPGDDTETQTDSKKVTQKASQIKPESITNGMNTADIYRAEEPKLEPEIPIVFATASAVKATKEKFLFLPNVIF